MKMVLKEKSKNVMKLEHCIKQNFEKNIPNEESWKNGGFFSLKLNADFYESNTAARIFKKFFGIKKCTVLLEDLQYEMEIKKVRITYLHSLYFEVVRRLFFIFQ